LTFNKKIAITLIFFFPKSNANHFFDKIILLLISVIDIDNVKLPLEMEGVMSVYRDFFVVVGKIAQLFALKVLESFKFFLLLLSS
jgi:hypothetical protein